MIDPVSSAVTSLFVSYRKHAETLRKADYHDLRDVFKWMVSVYTDQLLRIHTRCLQNTSFHMWGHWKLLIMSKQSRKLGKTKFRTAQPPTQTFLECLNGVWNPIHLFAHNFVRAEVSLLPGFYSVYEIFCVACLSLSWFIWFVYVPEAYKTNQLPHWQATRTTS